MGEFLGVLAAVMFGTSHFFNGVLARRIPAMSVAVYSQAGGALFFLAWALSIFWTQGDLEPMGDQDFGWAVLSGIGSGIGVAALYEGMRRHNISIAVPVTSIVSVAVPFILSTTLLGEPLQLHTAAAGVMLLPAIWLLSRPNRHGTLLGQPDLQARQNVFAAVYGVIAGAGYATQLFALSRITSAVPVEPLLTGQLVSLVPLLALAWFRAAPLRLRKTTLQAATVGLVAALAMAFYLYATRHALLGPVMIAIALYPAIPVLLALLVLKERLSRFQSAGLAIAAVVVPVVSLAS
ncbi:DMT family transporter [Nesterenkonia cremea]|uniref:EamA domain-containing protein n=1 Tax=Nesterenkonia cremea TaxID=1882340 RepID=A0A917EQN7_9MICC|nr:DMT family transporter [Nesterenkonia cremea]GGE76273.1 hypothetical protein GCM10011401_24550 [Nesterenkonia cremea]